MTLDIQLVGSTTKMAILKLTPGQVVYSEAGKFLRDGPGVLALAGVLPGEMRTIELDGRTTWCAGGEGFSVATLEGDRQVILQSVTIEALAKALEKSMGVGDRKTGAGLGGIFSGSAD